LEVSECPFSYVRIPSMDHHQYNSCSQHILWLLEEPGGVCTVEFDERDGVRNLS
jgi:hypothetical protein